MVRRSTLTSTNWSNSNYQNSSKKNGEKNGKGIGQREADISGDSLSVATSHRRLHLNLVHWEQNGWGGLDPDEFEPDQAYTFVIELQNTSRRATYGSFLFLPRDHGIELLKMRNLSMCRGMNRSPPCLREIFFST